MDYVMHYFRWTYPVECGFCDIFAVLAENMVQGICYCLTLRFYSARFIKWLMTVLKI